MCRLLPHGGSSAGCEGPTGQSPPARSGLVRLARWAGLAQVGGGRCRDGSDDA